jgi:hypothetical protein
MGTGGFSGCDGSGRCQAESGEPTGLTMDHQPILDRAFHKDGIHTEGSHLDINRTLHFETFQP